MSDCYLTQTHQFSAISWREQVNCQWHDVRLVAFLILLVHWNNSLWIDMLSHTDLTQRPYNWYLICCFCAKHAALRRESKDRLARNPDIKCVCVNKCIVLELYNTCIVLELYNKCIVLELYNKCIVLELYNKCIILELYNTCIVLELYNKCYYTFIVQF
jgi:hypothetical protein